MVSQSTSTSFARTPFALLLVIIPNFFRSSIHRVSCSAAVSAPLPSLSLPSTSTSWSPLKNSIRLSSQVPSFLDSTSTSSHLHAPTLQAFSRATSSGLPCFCKTLLPQSIFPPWYSSLSTPLLPSQHFPLRSVNTFSSLRSLFKHFAQDSSSSFWSSLSHCFLVHSFISLTYPDYLQPFPPPFSSQTHFSLFPTNTHSLSHRLSRSLALSHSSHKVPLFSPADTTLSY